MKEEIQQLTNNLDKIAQSAISNRRQKLFVPFFRLNMV